MSLAQAERERIRWHCRRGMLELDLVLNAFLDSHLDRLGPQQLDALRAVLECADPELLNLVMGHEEPVGAAECEIVALLRAAVVGRRTGQSLTPQPRAAGRGEIYGVDS